MSIEASKQLLRGEIRDLRQRIDPALRREAGRAVASLVLRSPQLCTGRRVALYSSLPDEVPTGDMLEGLLERQHTVLLPRAGRNRQLEFALVHDPARLVPGPFGILEPSPDTPAELLHSRDLVLLPGVAFDAKGGRLGRGGGWYDRSLPLDVQALFGIAFHFQIIPCVPMAPLDRRVRGVFTEYGLLPAITERRDRTVDPS